MAANLETWLAEENSIVQKSDNEKQVYLYDWLDRLIDHLKSGNMNNVSKHTHTILYLPYFIALFYSVLIILHHSIG